MSILQSHTLNCNKQFKINFGGGELSSDSGILLIKDFAEKSGFEDLVRKKFKTHDTAAFRFHTDAENLMQVIYQTEAGYYRDDCSDELRHDPVMTAAVGTDVLASQPSISRFFNRMDKYTLQQLTDIMRAYRKTVYSINNPEHMLLDLDSTLLNTYGNQEGEDFNYHYQAHGYHPLLCFDSLTGDLIKAELRKGSMHCCNGADVFMGNLLDELHEDFPETKMFFRGDSGFAASDLYDILEEKDCKYAIRLKESSKLREQVSFMDEELTKALMHKGNMVDYAVCYDEFMYQAKGWKHPRRVVCKIEKPYGQLVHMHTFIVTNMKLTVSDVISYYCNRGRMENFIKECKNGFGFETMSSSSMIVNANRLMIHCLAYNLFNCFRRLVLPESMKKLQADTIRLKLLKTASKVVYSARYIIFRLCSSCPYKDRFYEALTNIRQLQLQTG